MNEHVILNYTIQNMLLILYISMPPIIVATVIGLLVAIFQAVTQIQEQTLSYAVKLVAVIVALIFISRWAGMQLLTYSRDIFDTFYKSL